MKLHISNLSPKVSEQQLQNLFGKFGQVLHVGITWSQTAGRTTGSAIVEMHLSEAMAALDRLNGQAFRNRRLYITPLDDVKNRVRNMEETTRPGRDGKVRVAAGSPG